MELKDFVLTRVHQACDAKKIPQGERVAILTEVLQDAVFAVTDMIITDWFLGHRELSLTALEFLALWLGVEPKWLIEGKGPRYRERLGLGANQVDWVVEQKKLYDFDYGEMKDKALAWMLLHMPLEIVNEFCSAENGHDPRAMRVDIRVNDVELPVKRFEDIITNLSKAMLEYKWRELGLEAIEKSAHTQAEAVLRKLHGDTYDKLGEVMSQLDNMRDNIGTLNELAWSAYSREALHTIGAFSVQLPPHPEHYFDEAQHGKSGRQHAIELLVRMINGARNDLFKNDLKVSDFPKEHERLDKIARSIYHDLSEKEQAYCDANIAMSDFNKELQ